MLNSQPDPARSVRRFCIALTSALWLSGAMAAPDATAPTPLTDPVTRFLADKGLIATPGAPGANAGPGAAEPAPANNPAFVVRLRDRASDMVLTAMNFLGAPYRRGGNTADHGFDCSGFTRHVFEMSLGLVLPHRASEQATTAGLLNIRRDELKPGDLVFFNTMRRTFSHVGIYVGEGKFIHAPKPGGEVRVEDMRTAYWDKRFTGGRRAATGTETTALPLIESSGTAPLTVGPVLQAPRTLY